MPFAFVRKLRMHTFDIHRIQPPTCSRRWPATRQNHTRFYPLLRVRERIKCLDKQCTVMHRYFEVSFLCVSCTKYSFDAFQFLLVPFLFSSFSFTSAHFLNKFNLKCLLCINQTDCEADDEIRILEDLTNILLIF